MCPTVSSCASKGNSIDRIIPKPAFYRGRFQVAGIKRFASFSGNLDKGVERARDVLILNSTETGLTLAILESSVTIACPTAASADLADHHVAGPAASDGGRSFWLQP
jgi:N-[(2S)-2-amino-2-carboxyethyl]-L-glutamate dehydrogenase